MMPLCHLTAVMLLFFLFADGVNASQTASLWERSLAAVNDTTPFAIADPEDQEKGWFHGAWGGIKRIWDQGTSDIYLSGRYWHTSLGFTDEDRDRYDDWGLGGGYGRSLTDEKGNQRLLYAMIVQDSFEKPMYLTGVGWQAQWRLPGDLRAGAGYSVVIIANSIATEYIPFPAPAPLVSIGNEKVSLYCTFFNSILYFFAKMSF